MQNRTGCQLFVPTVTVEDASDCSNEFSSLEDEIKSCWNAHNGKNNEIVTNVEKVTLPQKFTNLQSCAHLGRESIVKEIKEDSQHEVSDITLREKDCGLALQWIRQEIFLMKEQDKSLLRQFIELRAKILRLRCLLDISDSYSDASSLNGSTSSLNEQGKSFPMQRLTVGNEFSMINKQSISLPSSPQVVRLGLNKKGPLAGLSQWDVEEDDG